jgi:hypothetical protein
MNSQSLKYAEYWRTSLADGALGKGIFGGQDAEKLRRPLDELTRGRLDQDFVNQLFERKPKDVHSVQVIIRPKVVVRTVEHAAQKRCGLPEIITPVVTTASFTRDGWLYPRYTVIARDILEPLERGSFAIGAVEDLDRFLTMNPSSAHAADLTQEAGDRSWHAERWSSYLSYCEQLLGQVAGGWPKGDSSYELSNGWFFEEADNSSGATQRILKLYDHIWSKRPRLPLFECYASEAVHPQQPCLPANTGFSIRMTRSLWPRLNGMFFRI